MIEEGSIVEIEVMLDDEQIWEYGVVMEITGDKATVKVPNVGCITDELASLRLYTGPYVVLDVYDGYTGIEQSDDVALLYFDNMEFDYDNTPPDNDTEKEWDEWAETSDATAYYRDEIDPEAADDE